MKRQEVVATMQQRSHYSTGTVEDSQLQTGRNQNNSRFGGFSEGHIVASNARVMTCVEGLASASASEKWKFDNNGRGAAFMRRDSVSTDEIQKTPLRTGKVRPRGNSSSMVDSCKKWKTEQKPTV